MEPMDETEFSELTDRVLDAIDRALCELTVVDDSQRKEGGILDAVLDDGERIIINRHSAAREIWLAAKSGGRHFRRSGDRWVDTRSGEELHVTLSKMLTRPGATPVTLDPFP
jgi:CyaY protein